MKIFITLITLAGMCTGVASPTLDLNTKEGEERLINSQYSNAYWALNTYYLSQKSTSCGSASAVMILNALNIYRPKVEEYFNYTLFTPSKFLEAISDVITQEEIKTCRMSLQVLSDSLKVFSLDTTPIYADAITLEDFRGLLKDNLNNPQLFLIANYFRPSIGQKGKGNFSPIGAYDAASDSVLLLDPLRDKYGSFWVSAEDLFTSMNQLDASQKARGLILVERQYVEIFSESGMKMIKNSQFRQDYFKLSRYFETQEHWTFCAVASSVAVMNALLDKATFSQENLFTEQIEKEVVTAQDVKTDWRGLTATELVHMLDLHGFSATFTAADTFTADEFREVLKTVLNDPQQFIIANYNRPQVSQVGGGHFSPIVAYDQETDSVLVMDTTTYKYAPAWIKLKTFFNSMHTQDSSGKFRGYVIVQRTQ